MTRRTKRTEVATVGRRFVAETPFSPVSPRAFQFAGRFFRDSASSIPRFTDFIPARRRRPPSSCWELSTRNSTGSKVLVYMLSARAGEIAEVAPRFEPSHDPSAISEDASVEDAARSCLERENDPRPRSNSADPVLGHQGPAGRNLKTRSRDEIYRRCGHLDISIFGDKRNDGG